MCLAERKWVPPEGQPLLFTPQTWPLRRFPPEAKPEAMRISISVYEGPERSAIVQLLRIMGARYTSKLKRKNTHLICRAAEGHKFGRAQGWGITVVRG